MKLIYTNDFKKYRNLVTKKIINVSSFGKSILIDHVTFNEADTTMRACRVMNQVIDGRRVNCNLVCLGVQKPRPPILLLQDMVFYSRGNDY